MMPEEVAFSNSGDRNEEGLFLNPEDIAFWKYVVYRKTELNPLECLRSLTDTKDHPCLRGSKVVCERVYVCVCMQGCVLTFCIICFYD
jgi:hypothetical protein